MVPVASSAPSLSSPPRDPDPLPAGPPPPPDSSPGPRLEAPPGVASVARAGRTSLPDPLSLAGLGACIDEARAAALVRSDGPPDPTAFAALRARLVQARGKLPPEYREAVADPLLATLDRLGARGFARVLAEDPEREGEARLLLDVAQAVLQHGEGYQARATDAFQEVVSDLYDGFLSAEDRGDVKPPDAGVLPPLVRWGEAKAGPYTWPATATASLDVGAAVVSLPAANATRGVLAWAALAHETAGHDILAADAGLHDELAGAVREKLLADRQAPAVADYWADRIDETAADVMGVLNMGPAAAVGLVGYFRALNGAFGGTPSLRNVGRTDDPHPADIARAYLAAETVRLLPLQGASRWAEKLEAEADRDLGRIRFGETPVSAAVAKASAAAVAQAIVRTRLGALDGHAIGEIQSWGDRDEAIVAELRQGLSSGGGGAGEYAQGAYAAHAVAAAVYEAVSGAEGPSQVMGRMVAVLDAMHARDPDWIAAHRGAAAAASAA